MQVIYSIEIKLVQEHEIMISLDFIVFLCIVTHSFLTVILWKMSSIYVCISLHYTQKLRKWKNENYVGNINYSMWKSVSNGSG